LIYRFGNFSLDTERLELRRSDTLVAIEPQVFSVLVYLIENRDRVVGKDEMFSQVWQRRIVSDATLTSRINFARRAIGDSGRTQTVIRTFPRRGYRFTAAVEVEDPNCENPPGHQETRSNLPAKPSIAVLPFENMSADSEQEYFADGITEDIITALSKIRSLFVIARNSSFVYKGQATDVRTVSASLGVRYLLKGSVRKAAGQVRITGQLIDALTGAHLWADRFQGSVDDIFELQDQVTTQVTSAVVPSIRSAEISRARRKSPRDLNAYDYYLQALAQINLSNAGAAFPFLSQARVLAPDFAPAFGLEAWCRTMWSYSSDAPDFIENSAIAVDLARKALSLDDDDPELLGQIGYVLAFFEENINLGLELVRDALDAAPSLAWLWGSQGFLHMFFGDCADAVAAFEIARRLDPHDPLAYRNNLGMAQAKFLLGEHETALILANDALEHASKNVAVLRSLAAFYAQLGRADRAREFAKKHMAAYPGFSIKTYFDNHPIRHAENIDHFRQALCKAGLPE
jgi:TolB-like protein